ncbi:hypothetical protein PGTUg99_006891 [Puccinia graminis f. sp. tritici]|uniref:Core-binding (CB) domain-containing protein n=1 Tax=Puccinia graminis f. sp. tritici TaxID=56615 RepID=A0A5B0PCF9_PUCGR|nr:hypothetical protein PGTUg99_006891 [Puccinia graminis f. sp. tritici]
MGYNSAVTKFVSFQKVTGSSDFRLPISTRTLEEFCIWAGRNAVTSNLGKITANSLQKYVAGLKAWHVYHNEEFPTSNATRINLLLKSSAREDENVAKVSRKLPIMFWHLTYLWENLRSGDDFDKALLDLCVVAFWGLARMAELTYWSEKGDIPFAESVLTSDVAFSSGGGVEVATLTVRNTKTGRPGLGIVCSYSGTCWYLGTC